MFLLKNRIEFSSLEGLLFSDGEKLEVPTVVVTMGPEEACKLVKDAVSTSLRQWADQIIPIKGVCLDLGLRRLPNAANNFAFGLDQPVFYTNQSRAAKLSDDGTIVVHLIKYAGKESGDPKSTEKELEQTMDILQPQWRKEVVARQFLPHMTTTYTQTIPGASGPGPAVPQVKGLYVAEDIVHDSFLSFDAAAESTHARNPKAYLCKIVTNRCIDKIKSASRQREVYVGPWLPEPVLSEGIKQDPLYSYLLQDSISTAYMLLLQQLSWVERAVFLLREVLAYEYLEIAEIVGKSEANCRQIFHRSKRSLQNHREETVTRQEKTSLIVNQFVQALSSGNINQLLEIISSDAILLSDGGGKVHAAINPITGAGRIIRFLSGINSKLPIGFSFKLNPVNGQLGIVMYTNDFIYSVISFEVQNEKIDSIYIMLNPDKLTHLNR